MSTTYQPATHEAPCGDAFYTAADAKGHELLCDQCAGATEAAAVCPECDNGKHGNCTEWAYDEHDNLVECRCPDPAHRAGA